MGEVVLKMGMNCAPCDSCVEKFKKAACSFQGVERVKADSEKKQLTVIGKVDPTEIREWVAKETKMKAELISPQPKKVVRADKKPRDPKKDGRADEKHREKEVVKKAVEKKDDRKVTIVLKIPMNSPNFTEDFIKAALLSEGVELVEVDCVNKQLTVNGKVDPAKNQKMLEQNIKKRFELVSPQPQDGRADHKKFIKEVREQEVNLHVHGKGNVNLHVHGNANVNVNVHMHGNGKGKEQNKIKEAARHGVKAGFENKQLRKVDPKRPSKMLEQKIN